MHILRRIRSWFIDGFRRLRHRRRRRTLTNTLPPEIFRLILTFVRPYEPCFQSKIFIACQQEDLSKGRKTKDAFGSIRIWGELQLRLVNSFCLAFVASTCKLCLKITCSPISAAPETFETELTYIGHGCDMVLFSHHGKSKFKGYNDVMTSYWLASVDAVVLHLDLSAHHSCSADIWPWLSAVVALLPPNIRSFKLLLLSDKSKYTPAAFSALWRGNGCPALNSFMPQDLVKTLAKLKAEQLWVFCHRPPEFRLSEEHSCLVEPAIYELFREVLQACSSATVLRVPLQFLRQASGSPPRPAITDLEVALTNFEKLASTPPLAAGNPLEAVAQLFPSLKTIRFIKLVLSDVVRPVDFSPFLQLNHLETVDIAGDTDFETLAAWVNVSGSNVEILHGSILNLSIAVKSPFSENSLSPADIATFKKLLGMSACGLKALRLVGLFTVQQCCQLFLAKLAKLTSLTSLHLHFVDGSGSNSRDDDITQLLSAIKSSMPNLADLSLIHDTLAMLPAMPAADILKHCPESVSSLHLGGNLISVGENAFLDSLASVAGLESLFELLESLTLALSCLTTIHLDFEIFRPANAVWPPFLFRAIGLMSSLRGDGVIETAADGTKLKYIFVNYNDSDEIDGVKPCIRVQIIRPDGHALKINLKFVAKTPVVE